jgi:hypothetical protein
MTFTAAQLAEKLHGEVIGDDSVILTVLPPLTAPRPAI